MYETLTPDFSEAVEMNNEQVPPGVYKARVDSWELKHSQKDGTPYLKWKLVIFGCDGDLTRQNNRPVFHTTMLKGPGAGILKQFLTATMGELPTTFTEGWQNEVIGREIQITLAKNIRPDGTEGMPNVKSVKAL